MGKSHVFYYFLSACGVLICFWRMSVSFLSGEYCITLFLTGTGIYCLYPSSSFPESSAVTCVCSEVKMTWEFSDTEQPLGLFRVRCAGNFISLAWTVRRHFNGNVQLTGVLVKCDVWKFFIIYSASCLSKSIFIIKMAHMAHTLQSVLKPYTFLCAIRQNWSLFSP